MTAQKVNSYFAILLITIVSSGATLVIVHVATQTNFPIITESNVTYQPAQ